MCAVLQVVFPSQRLESSEYQRSNYVLLKDQGTEKAKPQVFLGSQLDCPHAVLGLSGF